jgi:hypothetical protein
VTIDPIDQLRATVAHLLLDLETRDLHEVPSIAVARVFSGPEDAIDGLESCGAVGVSKCSRSYLAYIHAAQYAHRVEALPEISDPPTASSGEEQA